MKKFLIVLLCLLIVLGIGGYCGYRYYHNTYLKIGEETYRRDIQELDFSNGELPGLELLKELTGLQNICSLLQWRTAISNCCLTCRD